MGEFVLIPAVRIGKPGEFITEGDAIYESDTYGTILVPEGFVTDFASIPDWVPRRLFDPLDHARKSALFHDRLCRVASSYKERVMADHVFREAMKDEGVKPWRRFFMYQAVRNNTRWMRLRGEWR